MTTGKQALKAKMVTTRQLTVSKKAFPRKKNRYIYFPELHLRGKWLQQTGFCIGQGIDIICEEGKLTITVRS